MKTSVEVWVTITMCRDDWRAVVSCVEHAKMQSTSLGRFQELARDAIGKSMTWAGERILANPPPAPASRPSSVGSRSDLEAPKESDAAND